MLWPESVSEKKKFITVHIEKLEKQQTERSDLTVNLLQFFQVSTTLSESSFTKNHPH
jgi:hypothetical protein